MIPRIIHYCWFGPKTIPQEQQQFIQDWKRIMPEYEFRFWSEKNSPMHLPYMQTAYKNQKWANLSNFVRLQAVYDCGGIYLDTDVKVLKSFDDLLNHLCFLGFETNAQNKRLTINNAVFGAVPKHPFIKECKTYLLSHFSGSELSHESSPRMVTKLLAKKGLQQYGNQALDGVTLYENDYFYPYQWDEEFSQDCVTENTHAIHFWSKSWHAKKRQSKYLSNRSRLRRLLFRHLPQLSTIYQLINVYNQYGDIGIKLYRLRSVQRGPFQGMKFRSLNTKKSTLFPKLIGCYEECLHEPIYDLIDNHYSKIIDIGCAEGYYAIGLARMFNDARVSGYDLDPDAIQQAQQNARINGLSDRVELTAERYTQEMLLAEDFTGPALIMCDAQGDEMNLFTAETVSRLKNVDLIIEMHNFVDPRIKTTLLQLFSPTHCSKMVEQMSTSPVVSSFFQSSPETNKLFKLMDEGRPEKMEWLILKRRRSNPETL